MRCSRGSRTAATIVLILLGLPAYPLFRRRKTAALTESQRHNRFTVTRDPRTVNGGAPPQPEATACFRKLRRRRKRYHCALRKWTLESVRSDRN